MANRTALRWELAGVAVIFLMGSCAVAGEAGKVAGHLNGSRDVYLSLGDAARSTAGWGTPHDGASITGAPLRTESVTFEHGIGTHAVRQEEVGCYNWGLVNGRTQCQYPWGSPKDAPEPKVWFHDLLRRDGSPKNPDEIAFIRRFTETPGTNRLKPLFDFPVRDTSVCVGPDRTYYLTGTTGAPAWWKTNEGIRMWKSRDLKTWEPLGLVWSFEKDMTLRKKRGENQAIWAPEIHCFNKAFWVAYCVNYQGRGILKSSTGKPEVPYVDIKPGGPLPGEIGDSLFRDDDGKVLKKGIDLYDPKVITCFGNLSVSALLGQRQALEEELQRKIPYAAGGGFIMHSDHSILFGVRYGQYCWALRRAQEIFAAASLRIPLIPQDPRTTLRER